MSELAKYEVTDGRAIPGNPGAARGDPIRVGFLTPSLLLGGAERWLLALAQECDREAISWVGTALLHGAPSDSRLCRALCGRMPIYGGPVRGDGPHDRTYVTRLRTAQRAIDLIAERAQVIIAWGLSNLTAVLPRFPGRVVLVAHGSDAASRAAMRASEPRATDFAAVSEPSKASFSDHARSQAVILHNGVDVARCAPTMGRQAQRALWGCSQQHTLIGHVGRLGREKCPHAAAWAAHHLGGDCRAVYVGPASPDVWAEIVAIAGPRALRFPPVEQVGKVLAALDVFVLASPAEGFSLALTEAWLAGLPTVATPVGAVPELERRFGPLTVRIPVDPSPAQLGMAVEAALGPENRDRVRRARAVAWRHFTSGAMSTRWVNYVRTLAAGSGATPPSVSLPLVPVCP